MSLFFGRSESKPPLKPSHNGNSNVAVLRDKSGRERSTATGNSFMKSKDELTLLRQAKAALEAQLEHERNVSYELRQKLEQVGSPNMHESKNKRQSTNSAAVPFTFDPEDLAPAPDDDEVQAEAMGNLLNKAGRTTGTKKGKSILNKRRVSNMNESGSITAGSGILVQGVVRRGLQREESSRSTDFIAKILNEHLQKKQTENKFAGLVQKVITSSKEDKAGKGALADKKDVAKKESSSSGVDDNKRQSTNPKALHNRTPSFLKKVLAHKSTNRGDGNRLDGMMNLPRGGVLCTTSAGPVQFGMVPETIKDSMEMGVQVPSIFVVPQERFNLHEGVNVAEIEFPAFFNFFVLRKKVRLVTWRETVDDLRAIMQEALLGPFPENLFVESEYSKFVSKEVYDRRANHQREMEYFATPRAPDFYKITIDELIKFEFFDEETGVVDLGNGVTIQDDLKDGFLITDSGTEMRKRMDSKNLDGDDKDKTPEDIANERKVEEVFAEPITMYVPYERASSCLSVPPSLKASAEAGETGHFVIPQFGVTVLGNSHGFDPEGSTSGFVIWVNGQGAMVDPPPHSTMLLMKAGIQPKSVTAIILTHCHADHEVGTIQKMVTEDKVVLMTTKTIMESFLRKYEAVTGLEAGFLGQLVNFRPVYLEEPTYWNGASFRFFYSLHSIPCVGFEVHFENKRIVYSADTYYDPDGLKAMAEMGVLSPGRLHALLNFPWDADVVLHEMGVPPIHTPLEALEKLPEKFRKHIHLIHIGAKTARDAKKRGFKIATPGVENTISLLKAPDQDDVMMKFFQLISMMDIFRGFSLAQALELWFMAKSMNYGVGEHIVEEGTPGDKFMIILKGSASVTFGGNKKVFKSGDFLGEVSVVTGAVRTATVVADTPVTTFEVDRYAFDYLVMHDPRLKVRMENLIKARSDGSWTAIMTNSLLSKFTSSQKTQLQALLNVRTLKKGEVVWSKGEQVKLGVLISKGGLRFQEVHGPVDMKAKGKKDDESPLTGGMFIFDMLGVMNGYPLTTTLVCDTDVALIFTCDAEGISGYLDTNPLLLLGLLKSVVII